MILDEFKLSNTIFQIQYPDSFGLWDRAGAISKQLNKIWPNLKIAEGQPQQQTLNSKEVNIQTGLNKSTITLVGEKSFDHQKVKQVKESFELWRSELELVNLSRVSTRVMFIKEFPTMRDANAFVFNMNLAQWPESKVFDQPQDSELNSIELLYRFEDDESFSVLRVRAEKLTFEVDLDPQYVENPEIRVTKNRVIIDFDRGLLGSVAAEKLLVDEWFKGYNHILRRDIDKVIRKKQ